MPLSSQPYQYTSVQEIIRKNRVRALSNVSESVLSFLDEGTSVGAHPLIEPLY